MSVYYYCYAMINTFHNVRSVYFIVLVVMVMDVCGSIIFRLGLWPYNRCTSFYDFALHYFSSCYLVFREVKLFHISIKFYCAEHIHFGKLNMIDYMLHACLNIYFHCDFIYDFIFFQLVICYKLIFFV